MESSRSIWLKTTSRDEFFVSLCQWQSATKSINQDELPVKEKHVRSETNLNEIRIDEKKCSNIDLDLCFGTFQLEGARLFWSMISRIHVESHPILCWKFLYVFHRLLREGHRYVSRL